MSENGHCDRLDVLLFTWYAEPVWLWMNQLDHSEKSQLQVGVTVVRLKRSYFKLCWE